VRVTAAGALGFGLEAKALKMLELSFLRVGGLLVVVGFFVVVESDLMLEVRLSAGLVLESGVGALVVVGFAAAAGFGAALGTVTGGGGGRAPVRRWVVVSMVGPRDASGTGRTFASGLCIVPYVFHVCNRSSLAYSVVILRLQSDRIWMFCNSVSIELLLTSVSSTYFQRARFQTVDMY